MPLQPAEMSVEDTCMLLLARCDAQRGAEFIAVSDWGDVAGAADSSDGVMVEIRRCFESVTRGHTYSFPR